MKIEDIKGKTIGRVEANGYPNVGYAIYFTDETIAYIWADYSILHIAQASNNDSGGEPPNEFQRMKLECREVGLMLRDDNGDCYNWKSNPKGFTLPRLEKWARSQCPEAREGCPKVSADSMGQLLPPVQKINVRAFSLKP